MPIIPRSPVYSSERATGIEISRENALCFTSLNKIPMLASQSINSGKYRILKSAKLRLNAKQQNIAMSTEEIPIASAPRPLAYQIRKCQKRRYNSKNQPPHKVRNIRDKSLAKTLVHTYVPYQTLTHKKTDKNINP